MQEAQRAAKEAAKAGGGSGKPVQQAKTDTKKPPTQKPQAQAKKTNPEQPQNVDSE